jgi:hypothetical protein
MAERLSGVGQLRGFIREVGKMPADLRKELRPALRESAQPALADAKQNAGWSNRIPGATRLSVSFSKRTPGVALTVDRRKAPHARAFEHGGQSGWFRTPVFGNRKVWVRRRARPFLWPAAKPWVENIDADIGRAVDNVTERMGFK